MPTEPQQKDLVEEARKLLAEMPRRLMPLSDCEIHLLRQLADEVERLRGELDDAYFDRNECGGRP